MSRMSQTHNITLSKYQQSKLTSITGNSNLKSAIVNFVRNNINLPPIDDASPVIAKRFRLPEDVALILLSKGDSVSGGLRNMMGVTKLKPSKRTHRDITVTRSQYDMLKVLGDGDINEGLKMVLGA